MSYGNWKQVIGIFELWKLSNGGILEISIKTHGPTIETRQIHFKALLLQHSTQRLIIVHKSFTWKNLKQKIHNISHLSSPISHTFPFTPFFSDHPFVLHPSPQSLWQHCPTQTWPLLRPATTWQDRDWRRGSHWWCWAYETKWRRNVDR